ncbi:MAG: hypothetical protein DRN64_01935, partial [Thaumarchaeota archaeon]
KILDKALELMSSKPKNPMGELIKWMISQKLAQPKKAPALAKLILDMLAAYTSSYEPEAIRRVAENELTIYRKAAEFLEREFNAKIEIYREGEKDVYDPRGKASSALPLRPGVYVE